MAQAPADHVAYWARFFRDKVANGVRDASRKPVLVYVGGPDADAALAALDPSGAVLPRVTDEGAALADPHAPVIICCGDETLAQRWRAAARSTQRVFSVVRNPLLTADAPATAAGASDAGSYAVHSYDIAALRRYLLPDVVAACGDKMVALAAKAPAFRTTVATKLSFDCAAQSLTVAAVSALADHVPIIGFITGGIASAGDTIAITGMQLNMLLNIAAAYGKKPEFARIVELLPVVGGGYGWRALARELSGFIPVAGVPIKAAIAYAGTLVVGLGAAYYYEHGVAMSPDGVKRIYDDAVNRAKLMAQDLISRLTKRS